MDFSKVTFKRKFVCILFTLILTTGAIILKDDSFALSEYIENLPFSSVMSDMDNKPEEEVVEDKEEIETTVGPELSTGQNSLISPELLTLNPLVEEENSEEIVEENGFINRYSWKTDENYTTYDIDNSSEFKTKVSFDNTIPFEYIERELVMYKSGDRLPNALTMTFNNIGNSVSHMTLCLEGDPKYKLNNGDDNYTQYYQEKIGEYDLDRDVELMSSDSMKNITLDISNEIKALEDYISEGLRLVVYIESDSNDIEKFDGVGEMEIFETSLICID